MRKYLQQRGYVVVVKQLENGCEVIGFSHENWQLDVKATAPTEEEALSQLVKKVRRLDRDSAEPRLSAPLSERRDHENRETRSSADIAARPSA